ncbi:MAG: hypothetical protein M3406_10420 [Chloroflexota bacterium]|nr:hypothetical protein [Chloroflexota bacterium]
MADEEKVRQAMERVNGKMSLAFLRHVAEAAMRGETLTVGDDLARKFGVSDSGSLGGAIGTAASTLARITGRWVADRIDVNPSVWRMSEADASLILAILDERDKKRAA